MRTLRILIMTASISRMTRRRNPKDVIGRLAGDGKETFTLADLQVRFDLTTEQAQQLGHRLTRRNFARRLKRGLYAILPPQDWLAEAGHGLDRYWTATETVRGEPHYLAFYTAMELHDMIQHPLRTVFVAVTKAHRPLTIGVTQVKFVTVTAAKLFGHEARRTTEGHVVQMAELERAFIDCVDRPDLCGGIEEVVRGFARRYIDVDPDRLLRDVHRLNKTLVTKRLGFLLEIVGADPELLLDLERAAGRIKRFVPLDKAAPHVAGDRNPRWELVLNTDVGRLFAAARR